MFIGEKEIKASKEIGKKTISGNPIIKVDFIDDTYQHLSKQMFDKIVSKEKCDLTALREKRIEPVLEIVLAVLRDWGITAGELPYFSIKLNQSLDFNTNQALLKLVSKYVPELKSLDEMDYLTIDRILKEEK